MSRNGKGDEGKWELVSDRVRKVRVRKVRVRKVRARKVRVRKVRRIWSTGRERQGREE